MGVLISSWLLALASAAPLQITAEHWGGFSDTVQWRMELDGSQGVLFASDERYRHSLTVDAAALDQVRLLADKIGFWDLKASYGRGHVEFNRCRLSIVQGARKKTVVLLAYPKREPPVGSEADEVRRAFLIWDAVKQLAGLGGLDDDCRVQLNMR